MNEQEEYKKTQRYEDLKSTQIVHLPDEGHKYRLEFSDGASAITGAAYFDYNDRLKTYEFIREQIDLLNGSVSKTELVPAAVTNSLPITKSPQRLIDSVQAVLATAMNLDPVKEPVPEALKHALGLLNNLLAHPASGLDKRPASAQIINNPELHEKAMAEAKAKIMITSDVAKLAGQFDDRQAAHEDDIHQAYSEGVAAGYQMALDGIALPQPVSDDVNALTPISLALADPNVTVVEPTDQ